MKDQVWRWQSGKCRESISAPEVNRTVLVATPCCIVRLQVDTHDPPFPRVHKLREGGADEPVAAGNENRRHRASRHERCQVRCW